MNIEKYRPQIVQAIEKNSYRKVKLGDLKLSLFPSLKLSAKKTKFFVDHPQFKNKEIIHCNKFSAGISYFSLLSTPKLKIKIKDAQINSLKIGNISSLSLLAKSKNSENEAPPQETAPESNEKEGFFKKFITKKIAKAKLNFFTENTFFEHKDTQKKESFSINNLKLAAKNIGKNSKNKISFEGIVGSSGKNKFKGPLKGEALFHAKKGDLNLVLDATNMSIETSALEKPPGSALTLKSSGRKEKEKLTLDAIELKIDKLVLKGSFSYNSENESIDAKLDSSQEEISKLSSLFPAIRKNNLQGIIQSNLKIDGPSKNPNINATLLLKNIQGSLAASGKEIDSFSAESKVTGTISNPSIRIEKIALIAGKNEVNGEIAISEISKPKIDISLSSKFLNLKDFSKTEKALQKKQVANKEAVPAHEKIAQLEKPIEDALSKKLYDTLELHLKLDIQEIFWLGSHFKKLNLRSKLVKRKLHISKLSTEVFGGNIIGTLSGDLIAKELKINTDLSLKNISISQVCTEHAPKWKKELSGSLNGKFKTQLKGVSEVAILKNLRGEYNFNIQKGTLNLPIEKISNDLFKSVPQSLKTGLIQKATNSKTNSFDGSFKEMKVNGTIAGEKINISELSILFAENRKEIGEIGIKGSGSIDFKKNLQFTGNALLNSKKVKWPEAVGPSGKIEIPIQLSGPLNSAKPNIDYTAKTLLPRLAKKQASKELNKVIEKNIKPQAEKILKKIVPKGDKLLEKGKDELKKLFKF